MSKHLFFLGNTPLLSQAEIQAIFPQKEIQLINNQIVEIDFEPGLAVERLINVFGGVIKIAKVEQEFSSLSNVQAYLIDYLTQQADKIEFAINNLSQSLKDISVSEIKKQLISLNHKVRYHEIKSPVGLSAALLLNKKQIIEYHLLELSQKDQPIKQPANRYLVARTIAVQDINQWTKRDREKPYFDRKKGMMPPKVARIMVNIALGYFHQKAEQFTQKKVDFFEQLNQKNNEIQLYDPFCGTGTILIEALLSNCFVFGSDIQMKAVVGAEKNLNWLINEYQLKQSFKIFQQDATQIKLADFQPELSENKKIDLIVTEPYLGKPKPKFELLENIFKGLEKLYLGSFKQWTKVLNQHALIAIIFPQVKTRQKVYNLDRLIDKLSDYGYNLKLGPILYQRPQAIVQRQIYLFKYKLKN